MALTSKSVFLYGFSITPSNASLDFASVNTQIAATAWRATLNTGFYSLTGLLAEVVRAMTAVDPLHTYTATANRSVSGGLQNRVTIATSGTYLKLYFGTGLRTASSVAPLIGFNAADYSAATTYTGAQSAGTVLVPTMIGYNFLRPTYTQKIFGAVNVSATGAKEAVVYARQKFWQAEFKYEPAAFVESDWIPFLEWAIQQKPFEMTPEVSAPTVFYEGTLESSSGDSKGLGFAMKEMLPALPNLYGTGLLKFRQTVPASGFILT